MLKMRLGHALARPVPETPFWTSNRLGRIG